MTRQNVEFCLQLLRETSASKHQARMQEIEDRHSEASSRSEQTFLAGFMGWSLYTVVAFLVGVRLFHAIKGTDISLSGNLMSSGMTLVMIFFSWFLLNYRQNTLARIAQIEVEADADEEADRKETESDNGERLQAIETACGKAASFSLDVVDDGYEIVLDTGESYPIADTDYVRRVLAVKSFTPSPVADARTVPARQPARDGQRRIHLSLIS